jgi:hypothetical protein
MYNNIEILHFITALFSVNACRSLEGRQGGECGRKGKYTTMQISWEGRIFTVMIMCHNSDERVDFHKANIHIFFCFTMSNGVKNEIRKSSRAKLTYWGMENQWSNCQIVVPKLLTKIMDSKVIIFTAKLCLYNHRLESHLTLETAFFVENRARKTIGTK